jgi:hypothetical protein
MKMQYNRVAWTLAIITYGTAIMPATCQTFAIPEPLQVEHRELHNRLETAAAESGKTGEAAKAVMKLLQGHFEKEEAYALPMLGALQTLANTSTEQKSLSPAQRKDLISQGERLRTELPEMLNEHKAIAASLQNMQAAARAEQKEQVAELAEEIMLHAKTEEKILYPAALLIGDYVRVTD